MPITASGGLSGRRRATALAAGAVLVGAIVVGAPAGADSSLGPILNLAPVAGLITGFGCAATPAVGHAACSGKFRAVRGANGHLSPMLVTSATGYGPADIRAAYKLTGKKGSGRTIAIVDAYDDPNAQADLNLYRSHFGLPACTTANGCFHKVNQHRAAAPLPAADPGWAEEISLDLDMASATCPDCHILLVEADSATDTDLMAAEDAASTSAGVVAVSNSYGGSEDASITGLDKHFQHPGIVYTASSGDSGYGAQWPASSASVTAVGGTSLTKASNSRGWSETAWDGSGSGCSAFEAKPSWQHDRGCAKRAEADVSAVADPNTGVAVYDTYNTCGTTSLCDTLISLGLAQGADGWVQAGGTSASSPIIAAVYALAGNHGSAKTVYSHPTLLFDVTSGSNGSCGGSYLCTATTGYDGPTGLGTPNGTGAF